MLHNTVGRTSYLMRNIRVANRQDSAQLLPSAGTQSVHAELQTQACRSSSVIIIIVHCFLKSPKLEPPPPPPLPLLSHPPLFLILFTVFSLIFILFSQDRTQNIDTMLWFITHWASFCFSVSSFRLMGLISIPPAPSDRCLWWSCQRASALQDHLSV